MKVSLIKQCLRTHLNPLLEKDRVIILFNDANIFKGSPFSKQAQKDYPYLSNHYDFRKSTFLKFKDFLENDGFQVIYTEECSQSFLERNLTSISDIQSFYYEDVLGEYEKTNVDFIPSSIKKSLTHLNTLLNEGPHKLLEKSKFSFSYFRKNYEKLSFLLTPENSAQKIRSSWDESNLKKFYDYLNDDHGRHYFETRNAFTGENFSTRLSHLLNLGQIHPKLIIKLINDYELKKEANKSTYWMKFELLWREYFYWLYFVHQKDFFQSQALNGGTLRLPELDFKDYLSQTEKNPLIKAMHNELFSTGFLSNRSRQIYASFIINETHLDWRYGAWLFQHTLNDYDLYSNWGNWNYLSGHGTDPRGPRFFKIIKQLKQYDPELEYLKRFNPFFNEETIWDELS